jgi:hypothetical protein
VLDFGQLINKKIGGRTGAHADDTIKWHILNRSLGDGALQIILTHHLPSLFQSTLFLNPGNIILTPVIIAGIAGFGEPT